MVVIPDVNETNNNKDQILGGYMTLGTTRSIQYQVLGVPEDLARCLSSFII